MTVAPAPRAFQRINVGYARTFKPGRLTVGLVVPIEAYPTPVPALAEHLQRVQQAEALGFSAVWLRDVPFHVPSFGDAGQLFDPFVYLGALAMVTDRIALGVSSVILPLRHPAHVAKAAASADVLSGGRVLLGVASGDRPPEYPAMDVPFEARGARFRDAMAYLRGVAEDWPILRNGFGDLNGQLDLLPKPVGGRLPLLITGGSRQSPEWVARHGDGWMTYPRPPQAQARTVADYRARLTAAGRPDQPVMQPLYVDLVDDPGASPRAIHLGFRCGTRFLRSHLQALQARGVNHVALNLRFNQAPIPQTLERLADAVLPDFAPEEGTL